MGGPVRRLEARFSSHLVFLVSQFCRFPALQMLLTLGQRLKAAREARGLSLADAAHETRVPAQRLQHLENDNIAAFGSMAYARAFLKLYSTYLDVDADEVLVDLPPPVLGGEQDYRYLTESHGTWLRERARSPVRLSDAAPSSRVQAIKSPLPAAIAVFVCVLAVAGLYGSYVVNNNVPESAPTAEQVVLPAPVTPTATKPDVAVMEQPAPASAMPAPSAQPEAVEQIQPAIPVKGL